MEDDLSFQQTQSSSGHRNRLHCIELKENRIESGFRCRVNGHRKRVSIRFSMRRANLNIVSLIGS